MRVLGAIAKYLWSRDGARLAIDTIADGEFLKRDGNKIVSAAGGGGTSDHAALSHLNWSSSGHTGTASRIAAFDSGGATTYWTGKDALASVLTTRGDLVTRDATEATRLPIGAANRLLASDGTDPAWQPVAGDVALSAGTWTVTDLTISGETRGDLLTRAAGSWVRLAPGTSGYALTSAGAGSDLTWARYQPYDAGALTSITAGTWAGATSITTVGTIGTGTWQGTAVGLGYGGTGAGTAAGARLNLGVATPPIFGHGRDGALAFDGAGAVAGYSKSGSTYTGTRDVAATSITISTGVTVIPAGFRIRCTGTLTIQGTGTITANGNAASGITGGSGGGVGGPGTLHAASASGASGRSTAGAGGGGAGTSVAIGGAGGAGGAAAGGSPAGGSGGTVTAPTAAQGDVRDPPWIFSGLIESTTGGGTASLDTGGAGGAGGHDGVSGNSGGGGGSAGALYIACDTIDNAGSITANGGAGGNATGTANGGGGGGGGGWLLLVYRATSGSGLGTVTASGGAAGNGSGAGSNGSPGSSGAAYTIQLT